MNWQPSAGPEALALRARLLEAARRFFSERGVMEVQTPVLVSSSCPDPNIPSIVAQPAGSAPMFLHTSPEHAMKRLLCSGSGDIYQIGPVFRDGEAGRRHNPEFTMIEWYRVGYSYLRLAAEVVELIQILLDAQAPVEKISYRDVFMRYARIDIHASDAIELAAVCKSSGIDVPESLATDGDALLDLLFGVVIAPGLASNRFYIVYDYPATQAALARIRPDQPPVAERFEVFFGGLELANGFHELGDAAEQRSRFESEQARYRLTGRTTPPLDERLLAALESGLPDCAGVAVGFDRVLMLAAAKNSLSEVIAFPFDRA